MAAGADIRTVQEMLGHTSYAFTADTYTCVTSRRLRDLADATATLVLQTLQQHTRTSSWTGPQDGRDYKINGVTP
jgi:hypothetical protein